MLYTKSTIEEIRKRCVVRQKFAKRIERSINNYKDKINRLNIDIDKQKKCIIDIFGVNPAIREYNPRIRDNVWNNYPNMLFWDYCRHNGPYISTTYIDDKIPLNVGIK